MGNSSWSSIIQKKYYSNKEECFIFELGDSENFQTAIFFQILSSRFFSNPTPIEIMEEDSAILSVCLVFGVIKGCLPKQHSRKT